jgi:hypothetical protein
MKVYMPGIVYKIVSQGIELNCFPGWRGVAETTLKFLAKGTKTVSELKRLTNAENSTGKHEDRGNHQFQ